MKYVTLIISCGITICAKASQADSVRTDSTYDLSEVTVTGARIINKVDRKLIMPTKTQVENSTNGYDLLKRLSLPGLQVNTAENAITSLRGGNVQVRINDVVASQQDILALRPDEVVRVEDIDNPGVRYSDSNLDHVINYVVKRRYAGYVGGLSTWQSFAGSMNNSNAYFKYNYKKSEFGVNYGFSYRDYKHIRRDNHATYITPDGDEARRDYTGYDTPFFYAINDVQLNYSLSDADKYTFNVKLAFNGSNTPFRGNNQLTGETGQQALYLYNKISDLITTPSIDVYYSRDMSRNQKIEIDVVGTHIATNHNYLLREYTFDTSPEQSMTVDPIYNYSYATKGNSNSIIGEAIYTKNFHNIALSAGGEYTYSHTDNKYTGNQNLNDVLNSNNLYAFTQVNGTLKPISYSLGLGANYISIHQDDTGFNKWTFRPQLTLSANIAKNISLRYSGRVTPQVPALSSLSNVRQQSNDLEAADGNPSLKPAYAYSNSLTADWNTSLLTIDLYGGLVYIPNAIMNSIIPEKQVSGSYLSITKPMNQKSYSDAYSAVNLTVHAIKDVLDLSFYGQYDHSRTHGLDYLHNYNAWYANASADLTLGKWNINYQFALQPKDAYGETVTGGERMSQLSVQYQWKDFKFGAGCSMLGYAQGFVYTGVTNSKYYKSDAKSYFTDNGNVAFFTISYDFSHGRKYESGNRSLYNSYSDSGVK